MELLPLLCVLLTLPNSLCGHPQTNEAADHQELGQDFNDRLTRIETLLEASLTKNAELENRIEVLEEENRQLKASVMTLTQKTEDGQTHQRAARAEENSGDLHDTGYLSRSQDKRRASRVQRIMLSDEPTVAFTATISSPNINSLGKGQPIVYDHVITNVGGAYHATTGIFTAPATGVYVFNFNTMVEPGDNECLALVKNGNMIQLSYAHGTGESRYESTSMTVTLLVKQSEEVWVRTVNNDNHGSGTVHGNSYSTFSGWLVAYME